jgi:hypothetical protein
MLKKLGRSRALLECAAGVFLRVRARKAKCATRLLLFPLKVQSCLTLSFGCLCGIRPGIAELVVTCEAFC